MAARAAAMRTEDELRTEQMAADVALEAQRTARVDGQAHNTRTLAEAEAHRVSAVMRALDGVVTREQPLKLRSRMPEHGVIFSDGIEADFLRFAAGVEATVTLADRSGRLAA